MTTALAGPPLAPVTRSDDAEKQRQLTRMKRRATGLLVAAAGTFALSRVLEARHGWLAYVRATAEASMVGGLADWFAITALFRHPLGVPIPHTAIIPQRKDRIGRALGGFVENNFLSREVIAARLRSFQAGQRAAEWIHEPENARLIARYVAEGMLSASQAMRDEDVRDFVTRTVILRARKVQVAPLLGKLLGVLTAGNRHQELLDRAVALIAKLVQENDELIREKIRDESPWWVPNLVDDKIHDKMVSGIEKTLREVDENPHHPIRERFDDALREFTERLRSSPETIARAESIKEEVLADPAVRQFSQSLWDDVKAALLRYAGRTAEADAPAGAIERALVSLGTAALADPVLLGKIDAWVEEVVLHVIQQYRSEVAQFIAQTVSAWDPEATTRKIELQIGRDLQFVRINGTLVGGLVGLILYTLGRLV